MTAYFDRDGLPMSISEWTFRFQHESYKRVGMDEVDGRRVSTVWLGIDHSFGRQGPPLIFESMVFAGDSWRDEWMQRYSTLADAVSGHERIVTWLRAGLRLDDGLLDRPAIEQRPDDV